MSHPSPVWTAGTVGGQPPRALQVCELPSVGPGESCPADSTGHPVSSRGPCPVLPGCRGQRDGGVTTGAGWRCQTPGGGGPSSQLPIESGPHSPGLASACGQPHCSSGHAVAVAAGSLPRRGAGSRARKGPWGAPPAPGWAPACGPGAAGLVQAGSRVGGCQGAAAVCARGAG